MKNETFILMMNNLLNDLGYTSKGYRPSNRKSFFTKTLQKLVDEIQNKFFDEFIDLIDEIYQWGELQNEQQYRKIFDNFRTQ